MNFWLHLPIGLSQISNKISKFSLSLSVQEERTREIEKGEQECPQVAEWKRKKKIPFTEITQIPIWIINY